MRRNRSGRGWKFSKPRRFRVAVRPKVRARRMARWGVAVLMAVLGLAAVGVVRNFPYARVAGKARALSLQAWHRHVPTLARVDRVLIEGVPASLERPLMESIGDPAEVRWGILEPYRIVRRLGVQFPCLKDVWFTRNWWQRTVTFHGTLHQPVARVHSGGKMFWLSESGKLYPVMEDLYPPQPWPWVELGRNAETEHLPLAQFLGAAAQEGALPSPLLRLEYRSPESGWEAKLGDGTKLLWGDLSWTEQKLSRLREVLSDAGDRFGPEMVADLRYFEDGKILVRPGHGLGPKLPGRPVTGAGIAGPLRL